MFSGKQHTKVNGEVFSLDNYIEFVFLDKVNFSSIKPITIREIKINSKKYSILEIKVNFPLLTMFFLNKGHIGELQGGVYTNEVDLIRSRYKIETL